MLQGAGEFNACGMTRYPSSVEQLIPTPGETRLQKTLPVPLQACVSYSRFTLCHPSIGHTSSVAACSHNCSEIAPMAKNICGLVTWAYCKCLTLSALQVKEDSSLHQNEKQQLCKPSASFWYSYVFNGLRTESVTFLRNVGTGKFIFPVCYEKEKTCVLYASVILSKDAPSPPPHSGLILAQMHPSARECSLLELEFNFFTQWKIKILKQ